MRILSILSLILILRTTQYQTEATLPGIFLLPFMPLPKTTPKVLISSTRQPTTRTPQVSLIAIPFPTTTLSPTLVAIPPPPQQQQQQHQAREGFVKLHKVLEHSKQSNYVSTLNTENTIQGFQNQNHHHQHPRNTFQLTEEERQTEPQHQHQIPFQSPPLVEPLQTTTLTSISPSLPGNHHHHQFEALATNQGPPQKEASASYQQHQLVPLTFPPSEDSSSDLYRHPRVISLPPLPPTKKEEEQTKQPQQQLPESSSHYTTSSLSYSFAQGYNSPPQAYGVPPRSTTKIVRHVSVFVAPPDTGYSGGSGRQKIRVQGEAEKHVNIIFIKSPDSGQSNNNVAEIDLPPSPEQKTYVYVLNKAPENNGQSQVVVNKPEPPKYNPPDVYFIKYKDNNGGGGQQYGVPPPPSKPSPLPPPPPPPQYGPPPQIIYGPPPSPPSPPSSPPPPPPPQQSYGPPPQQSYGPPPQISYGPPPKQQPPPQQQYGASNQQFNYTLPSSSTIHSNSYIAGLLNNSKVLGDAIYSNNDDNNNSLSINLSRAFETNKSVVILPNRRNGEEEETHYHVHHLSYLSSQDLVSNVQGSELEKNAKHSNGSILLGEKATDTKGFTGTGVGLGLYSQLVRDIASNNEVSSKGKNKEFFQGTNKSMNGEKKIVETIPASKTSTKTTITTPPKTKTSNTVEVGFTAAIPPTATKKYNAIADIIGNVRVLMPENKTSPTTSSDAPVYHQKGSDVDIIITNNNNSYNNKPVSTVNYSSTEVDGGNNKSERKRKGVYDDIDDDNDNIIILTKHNLTLLESESADSDFSGSFGKGNKAKERDKGRHRYYSSGRPNEGHDDFRPYEYAPSMDHNNFGVVRYQIHFR